MHVFLAAEDWQAWKYYWAAEDYFTSGIFFSSFSIYSLGSLMHAVLIYLAFGLWVSAR